MITYRLACADEADAIAHLHAQSWQKHYQGILSDEYLAAQVLTDRLKIWRDRFSNPKPEQYIVAAEDAGELCGFACTYADHDPQYGALLDNLHVLAKWQGRGIGAELLRASSRWLETAYPGSLLYLWVFCENWKARAFYEQMGAEYADQLMMTHPGGTEAEIIRCVWRRPL